MLLASGKGTYQPLDMDALSPEQASEISRKILQATKAEGWQLGNTRVFLRAGQLALLEVNVQLITGHIGSHANHTGTTE